MKCPRCDVEDLTEKSRDGVTIDVCKGCRGVWLDRGELERLIARAADGDEHGRRDDDRRGRRDDDDDDGGGGGRRGGGFFSTLRNIFD